MTIRYLHPWGSSYGRVQGLGFIGVRVQARREAQGP